MSDTFNVQASWDKASYTAGETITGTLSGTNHHVEDASTVQVTVGPVDVPVVTSPTGALGTAHFPSLTFPVTTPGAESDEPVLIDTSRSVVDSGPNPRVWVVSADRRSISAVA